MIPPSPVHFADDSEKEHPDWELSGYTSPGWYFWTETQADRLGPFATEADAHGALKEYGARLQGD